MAESHSTERKRNLWAPWRMAYLDTLEQRRDGCFLCRYRDEPDSDVPNHVLWRRERTFVLLNGFPYTGGHCMVAPYAHVGELADLDEPTMLEMMTQLRDAQAALAHALAPEGFNVGINIGLCAGAGLPDHLHMHIVPRWTGDTNFMPLFGDVRVIPEFMDRTREKLVAAARELGLA